jgi:hypothetical protein
MVQTSGTFPVMYMSESYMFMRHHDSLPNTLKSCALFSVHTYTCLSRAAAAAGPQEGDFVVLVQEYAAGGNLFDLLQRYGGRLNEHVTVQMVLEPFLRVLQVCGGGGGGGCVCGGGGGEV